VVVVASLIITTITIGPRRSFGVFFKSIESEFSLSRTATSALFSISSALGSLFGVWWGWALDRWGPRKVILIMSLVTGLGVVLTGRASSYWQLVMTYGVLVAMGSGVYPVVASAVSRWFTRKRGLAVAIAGSGIGLGTVVVSPLAALMIVNLGWRTSFVVLGLAVWLVAVPLSLLLRRDPGEMGLQPDGVPTVAGEPQDKNGTEPAGLLGLSLLEAIRTAPFWLLCLALFVQGTFINLALTHIVPQATDTGISPTTAATVLSLSGGMSSLGQLLGGRASDLIDSKRTIIIFTLCGAVAMICLLWANELWMFYLAAVLLGLFWGGITPATMVLIGDIFGLRSLGVIVGTISVAWMLGSSIGPLLGGFIFDLSGGYKAAFYAGTISLVVTSLFLPLVRPVERTKLP